MKFFTVLGVAFYTISICLIGLLLVFFSFHVLPLEYIGMVLEGLYTDFSSRWIIGLIGSLLILIAFSFAQLILGRMQKERTIAFSSASGCVTIALSAVEDLIKRLCTGITEIKELRPYVVARSKKGIEVDLRLILRSEINIPELTARLQEMVKTRLQDILGLDEQITVRIHVAKIISHEEKERKIKKEIEKPETNIPFGGYGRA